VKWVKTFCLGLTLGLCAEVQAQWNIFAENLPPAGSWATYEIARTDITSTDKAPEIKLSVWAAGEVNGKAYVWLNIEPVAWLGSREKAPLRFLVPKDLDREGANKLLESSAEILFSNPKTGPWYMLPEDVKFLANTAGYSTENTLVDDKKTERINFQNKTYECKKLHMVCTTNINPPFVKNQVIKIEGTVWRNESIPFGIVRAEWKEETTKGDKVSKESKRITLINHGVDNSFVPPLDHGERFHLLRLLFKR
jgi:hypothetical protein